jgi:hypothetical protein
MKTANLYRSTTPCASKPRYYPRAQFPSSPSASIRSQSSSSSSRSVGTSSSSFASERSRSKAGTPDFAGGGVDDLTVGRAAWILRPFWLLVMDIRPISEPVNAAAASATDYFDWGPRWTRGVICDFFTRARGGIGDRSRLQVEGGIRWRELRPDSERAPRRRVAGRASGAFWLGLTRHYPYSCSFFT